MNPLVETWKKGWYRLINKRYYPPYAVTVSGDIYRHVFYLIRWSFYVADPAFARRQIYADLDAKTQKMINTMLAHNRLPKELGYRHFTKPKKDGTDRHLAEPNPLLKAIQHEILKERFKGQQIHPAAMGFIKKKSIADHVWTHAGADIIITADIQDFFPNTRTDRIQAWWYGVYGDEDVARLMTILTTYQGGLPQGAPTSPMLSNLVNFEMDRQIAKRVELSGGSYSRYGDDMVFSWYHRPPSDFERAIRAILRAEGYDLHPKKGWNVYHKRDEPQVTGVILTKNGGVAVPDWVNQRIADLKKSAKDDEQAHNKLLGYFSYKLMIEKHKAML
ncbi:MAG: reverse transcriptase family protein [bacterium]|nr:reverse transcriptase family protein [bacterium]